MRINGDINLLIHKKKWKEYFVRWLNQNDRALRIAIFKFQNFRFD